MALVAAGAYPLFAALASGRRPRARAIVGSFGAALLATAFVSFLTVLSGIGRGFELRRSITDLWVFGVRPLELVLPAARNLVFGNWLQPFWEGRLHDSGPGETSNYLGLVTIALALSWLVMAWRGRPAPAADLRFTTAGLLSVSLVALMFAWPSPITIFGHQISMPARLLWEVLPGFRAPARWVALAMAALVPLAALALESARRKIARHSRWHAAPFALVVLVMLISLLELFVPPTQLRFRADPPAVYSAVTRVPPGVLAEYPPLSSKDVRDFFFWQIVHGRPLLNGAPPGTRGEDASLVLLDPRQPGTAEELAFLGVTAIVTHGDALGNERKLTMPGASWTRRYALVARRDGSSVWRVVAPPAPALVTLPSGFGRPQRLEAGVVAHPLISPSGVGYLQFTAKQPGVVRLRFNAQPPRGQRRIVRLTDDQVEREIALNGRTAISVLVQIPRGLSLLLVKTGPPATSEEDAILLSAPRAERASGRPDLHALPVSSDPGF